VNTSKDPCGRLRGLRRLGFCALVVLFAGAGLLTGKLTEASFVELIQWVATAYLASDGVEKTAAAWGQRRGAPAAVAPGADP
jgi:hypothetical protein